MCFVVFTYLIGLLITDQRKHPVSSVFKLKAMYVTPALLTCDKKDYEDMCFAVFTYLISLLITDQHNHPVSSVFKCVTPADLWQGGL